MDFNNKTVLVTTGLIAGRLGVSSSFGAPAEALEEAFERGCNYFTWGTFIKGRSSQMAMAIKNICAKGQRDNLILAMLSYTHSALLTEISIKKGLRVLGLDYADLLILGYFSKRPPQRVIDGAQKLVDQGLVRFIGITSHNRKLFPGLQHEKTFDIFHVRYNAVHSGAEQDIFPYLQKESRPGIVSFTGTCWKRLLNPKKMPAGEVAPTAADCYRFVLTNPSVDICMMGAKDIEQMRENLSVLEQGPMSGAELDRMRRIGDFIHTGN